MNELFEQHFGLSKLIICGMLILFLSPNVSAFYLYPGWSDGTSKIESIYVTYKSLNETDVSVLINARVSYVRNYSSYHPTSDIPLYFDPFEIYNYPPHSNFGFKICSGEFHENFVEFEKPCEPAANFNLTNHSREEWYLTEGGNIRVNYTTYSVEVRGLNESHGGSFLISFRYFIKDFIKKQGDYHYLSLDYHDVGNSQNMITWFYFPPGDDIFPTTVPEDVESVPGISIIDGYNVRTWIFKFKGTKDRKFFYTNFKDIRDKEESLQFKYALIGAGIGAVVGFLFSLISGYIFSRFNKCNKRYLVVKKKQSKKRQ